MDGRALVPAAGDRGPGRAGPAGGARARGASSTPAPAAASSRSRTCSERPEAVAVGARHLARRARPRPRERRAATASSARLSAARPRTGSSALAAAPFRRRPLEPALPSRSASRRTCRRPSATTIRGGRSSPGTTACTADPPAAGDRFPRYIEPGGLLRLRDRLRPGRSGALGDPGPPGRGASFAIEPDLEGIPRICLARLESAGARGSSRIAQAVDKFRNRRPRPARRARSPSPARRTPALPCLAAALLTARARPADRTCPTSRGHPDAAAAPRSTSAREIEAVGAPPRSRRRQIGSADAPYDLVKTMRAVGARPRPLLRARRIACASRCPGGCAIGVRPIDLHLAAFEKLGAEVRARPRLRRGQGARELDAAPRSSSTPSPSPGPRTSCSRRRWPADRRVLVNAAREPGGRGHSRAC